MTDELRLHGELAAGARAEAALGTFDEAFATLRAQYIAAWQQSGLTQHEARERLWQAVQIVDRVQQHLRQVAGGGKLAERQLEDIKRLGERARLFGVI